jgi:hypothetical protein
MQGIFCQTHQSSTPKFAIEIIRGEMKSKAYLSNGQHFSEKFQATQALIQSKASLWHKTSQPQILSSAIV